MQIIERLKKHDRNCIEIKYTFPIPEKLRKVDYETEMYLFVPDTLGINRSSYTSEKFYQDERNNIRLKTPQFLLKNIVNGQDSPCEKLKISMEKLVSSPNDNAALENCMRNIRLYCYVFKSALRDACSFIIHNAEFHEADRLINNIADECKQALSAFRETGLVIRVPGVPDKVHEMFRLADEYNVMLTDKYLFKLLSFAEKKDYAARTALSTLLKSEINYRKSRNFPVTTAHGSNEKLLYRMNLLKKLMGQALYIKTQTRKEGRLIGLMIPGIAAGIAVSIATILLFYTQQNIKEFGIALFLMIVGIYIVKDRLKDWTKAYFAMHTSRFMYDFRTILLNNNGKKIGVRRESFQFIKPENLPEEVARLRQKNSSGGIESGRSKEQILHTRRRIQLHSGSCSKLLDDFLVDGIHDIVRFNLRRFFPGMDNPDKELYVLENGHTKKVSGRRVYHLNMILRFSAGNVEDIQRFILVVTRKGIERIEEVF